MHYSAIAGYAIMHNTPIAGNVNHRWCRCHRLCKIALPLYGLIAQVINLVFEVIYILSQRYETDYICVHHRENYINAPLSL